MSKAYFDELYIQFAEHFKLSRTCNFLGSRLYNTKQLIEKTPTAFKFTLLIVKHRFFFYFNPNMDIILTGMCPWPSERRTESVKRKETYKQKHSPGSSTTAAEAIICIHQSKLYSAPRWLLSIVWGWYTAASMHSREKRQTSLKGLLKNHQLVFLSTENTNVHLKHIKYFISTL